MACVLETPLRMSVLSEVTASSRHYVDRLFDPDPQKVLQGVIDMKNAVIGNNKQKANLIVLGAVPRLLYLLQQETSSTELRTECAVVLGSLAMGTENNVKSLLDCHIIPALLQGLLSPELKFIEACLRCLRTIFTSPVTPEELLYTDATVIPHLMALLSRSRYTQEYICQIFSHCCKLRHWHSCGFKSSPQPLLCANGPDHQTILFNHGAVQNIAHLLSSTSYKVRMQALKCFSVLAFENPQVSMTLVNVLVDGELLPQIFVKMLQRDKPIEMQLTSAKCLTYMCRAGAIQTDDNCIVLKLDHDLKHAHELRQAAFKLYASLGANDEDIRKKIIETENMMDRIVNGLSESSIKVRLSAVRCLHSLSRSVQQLRTSFQDHAVWKPLMKVLQNAPDEVLVVASSTLCNLLLEFSPSKEPILESGAIELLCSLTQSENLALRVNGIWALMHIDQIMSSHGKQIMQAVTLILEGEHNIEVKEQTLCILANIADGTTAKELIMTNDDILQKIKYYMSHSNAKLQLAAMFCISNLIWNEEEGSQERQDKLRDIGIVDILHKLSQSSDPNLCDKAKTALQQYLA
ncbi:armadillo repeat-containing protein 8 isoform X29 [Dermochelys coriacea]|uniref:armadillo repeat-containing protein 8 isoform X29 n=1 Tax=Dermochelys coriacea TaxID=27794 RepID=UPI001CAA2F17|nr:armadillo repeat-containing protein 8 isoform X29 [Dermochelys coriacea]